MEGLSYSELRAVSRRIAKELTLVINDVAAGRTNEKEVLRSLRVVVFHQPALKRLRYAQALKRLLQREENNAVRLAAAGERERVAKGRPSGRQC